MATKKYIDFYKLFEEYVRDKYMNDQSVNPEVIKEKLASLYHEWSTTPLQTLGGQTPQAYYADIDDPKLLMEFLKTSCENEGSPNTFLLDRICELKESAGYLEKFIEQNFNPTLTQTAVELLQIMNESQPLQSYIKMLFEGELDSDLKETIIEALIENADAISSVLYAMIEDADLELKTILAEILIHAKKDDRTYNLLVELFQTGENTPLYAGYLGKYGDERCMPMLYRAADNCNYHEFIEIKNAIERLGGILDENYRDFSEDVYYKIIKEGYKT